jgi:hypothetical protein
VKNAAADRQISFKLDVMPVFMRAGCNTGACHGAARGRDGFRLSLFGFDPDGDWYRLTREMSGRRISVAIPEECLLLEKSSAPSSTRAASGSRPTASSTRRSSAGSRPARPRTAPTWPKPVSLEVYPPKLVLEGRRRDAAHDGAGRSTPTAPTATSRRWRSS